MGKNLDAPCTRQRQRIGIGGERLEQHAAVMGVIVGQPRKAQQCRADVGVIAEHGAELALLCHSRSDHAQPGLGDLGREIAMVPGKPLRRLLFNGGGLGTAPRLVGAVILAIDGGSE